MFMAKNSTKIFPTFIFFYYRFCKLYKGIVSSNEAHNVLTAGLLQLLYTVTVTVTMHYAACHHLSTVSLMGKV